MFYAGLILGYLKNYFKTRLTYRSDFWIELLSDLMFNGLNLIFILIMFTHTELIGEWNEQQVLFIYGYFMMASGLFNTFFNLWNFSERYIVKGEMDRVLTRPAYNLVQLVLENMDRRPYSAPWSGSSSWHIPGRSWALASRGRIRSCWCCWSSARL